MKKLQSLLLFFAIATSQLFAQSGTFGAGDALTWDFNTATNVLTIGGTGDIPRYRYLEDGDEPWIDFKSQIEQIVIGNGITSIGRSAFDNLPNLVNVTFGVALKKIDMEAFEGCIKLASVDLPMSLTSIGRGAFAECSSINSITIPVNVTSIEKEAFLSCGSLTVTALPSVPPSAADAFEDTEVTMLSLTSCDAAALYAAHNDWKDYDMVGDQDKALSITVDDPEHGTATGSGSFLCGKLVDISATAAEGFEFDHWSDGDLNNPRTIRVLDDETYTAYFKVQTFNVDFYDADHSELLHHVEVEYGSDVTEDAIETAIAAANEKALYCEEFDEWTGGVLTNIKADQVLTPTYVTKQFNISVTTEHGSVIMLDPNNETVSSTAYCGTEITCTPVADDCYKFIKWIVNGKQESIDEQLQFVLEDNTSIEAVFEIKLFDVTFFDADNNIIGEPQTVNCGEDAVAPADPESECQNFTGWDKDFTNVQADLEVYPLFEGITYSVRFFDADEQVISEQTVPCGEDATAPEDSPEMLCQNFTGWDKEFTNVREDLDIYPLFEPIPYTVIFFDADNEPISEQTVNCGEDATAPEDPELECQNFTGWDADFTNVQADLNIHPLFEGITYSVRFFDADEQVISEQTVPCGEDATAPEDTPELECQNFTGWDKDFTNVHDNLDIYPQFEIALIDVHFMSEDGEIELYTTQVECGSDVSAEEIAKAKEQAVLNEPECKKFTFFEGSTENIKEETFLFAKNVTEVFIITVLSEDPEKGTVSEGGGFDCGSTQTFTATANEGFEFDHWQEGENAYSENPLSVVITGAATFTAYFKVQTFDVDFYNADNSELLHHLEVEYGKDVPQADIDIADNAAINAAQPCQTFNGWEGGVLVNITADQQFTAAYLTKQFSIDVTSENGTVLLVDQDNEPVTSPADCGSQITCTPVTDDCHSFIKWIVNGEQESTDEQLQFVLEDNINIQAIFEPIPFTVVFYNADNEPISEQTVNCGEDAVAPEDLIVECQNFIGWDADFTNVQADLEIHPLFEGITYTVRFFNADEQVISEQTVPCGEDATAPEDTPEMACQNFTNWDKDFTNVHADLDIYPQFAPIPYTVIFFNADNEPISEQTVNCGEDAVAPEALVVECQNFIGWDADFTNVQADLEIHPLFEGITYSVRFFDADEQVISEQTVPCGEDATAPEDSPEMACQNFTGWDKDFTNVHADLDIYPQFEIALIAVHFMSEDGEIELYTTQVECGSDVSDEEIAKAKEQAILNEPECKKFTFFEGSTENIVEDTYLFAKNVTEVFIITVLSEDTEKGTVNTDGGGFDCGSTQTFTATANEGFEFDHWQEGENIYPENPLSVEIKGTATYTAYFSIPVFNVDFYNADNSELLHHLEVEYGKDVPEADIDFADNAAVNAAQPCQTFNGWEGGVLVNITAHQQLTATYLTKQFNIDVTAENGAVLMVDQNNEPVAGIADCGSQITCTPVANDCYHFTKWIINGEQESTDELLQLTLEDNINIQAVFEPIPFTVIFYNADNEPISEQTVNCGEDAVAPEALVVECQNFIGWDTDFTNVQADLEIHPLFEGTTYIVRFFDADEQVISEQTVPCGEDATAPEDSPEQACKDFTGWDKEFTNVHCDLDVYPLFEPLVIPVHFMSEDGNLELLSTNVECGSGISEEILGAAELQARLHAPECMEFSHYDGSLENITVETYLYAQYVISHFVIAVQSEDINKGTVSEGGAFECGSTQTITATAKEGYEFDYWQEGENSYTENPLTIEVTTDKTYTAHFKLQIFDVIFTLNGAEFHRIEEVEYGTNITLQQLNEARDILLPLLDVCQSFSGWDYETLTVTGPTEVKALAEVAKYHISVLTSDNNKGSVEGSGLFDCNTLVTLTATAATGYEFDHWTDTQSHDFTINPLEVLVQGEQTYTAYFKPQTFDVIFTLDGAEFHRLEDVEYGTVLTVAQLNEAQEVLQPLLNVCQSFDEWEYTSLTITGPTEIKAKLNIAQYQIIVATEDNQKGSVAGGGLFECNTTATLTATAATGYEFDHWTDNQGNEFQNNPLEIIANADSTLTAYFNIITFNVIFTLDGVKFHEILDVPYGTALTDLQIAEALDKLPLEECQTFDAWAEPIPSQILEDTEIKATLKTAQFTITALSENNSQGTAEGSGVFECNTTATLNATALTGFVFDYWTDADNNQLKNNPLDVVVNADATYLAHFKTQTFNVIFTLDGVKFHEILDVPYGEVLTDQQIAEALDKLPLEACQTFDAWAEPIPSQILEDTKIKATVKTAQFNITALSENNSQGTAEGSGVFECNTTATLNATALTGFVFDYWTDAENNQLKNNPLDVVVNADATYTAHFKTQTFNVIFTLDGVKFHEILDVPYGTVLTDQQITEALDKLPLEACQAFDAWAEPIPSQILEDTEIKATVKTAQFNITALSENNSQGTAEGSGVFECNTPATLSATALTGFVFDYWTDADNNQLKNNPLDVVVNADATYTAHFKTQTFNVIFTLDGVKFHEILDVPYGTVLTDLQIAEALDKLPLEACQTFDAWAEPIPSQILADTEIKATVKTAQFNITALSENNSQGTAEGSGVFECNTPATLTATALTGFVFDYWTDAENNQLKNNPLDVVVNADATYTAHFKTQTFNVIFTLDGVKFHEILDVPYGEALTDQQIAEAIDKLPLEDCQTFDAWAEPIPSQILADTEIKATVKTAQFNITALSENNSQGTVTGGGLIECNEHTTLTALALTGFEFDHWTDADNHEYKNNPLDVVVTADATYTAHFKTRKLNVIFTLDGVKFHEILNIEYGTALTDQQIAEALDKLPLEACQSFDAWVTPIPSPIVADTEIKASVKTAQYNVIVLSEDPAKGSVTGGGTFVCGDVKEIQATANLGYEFDHWSAGGQDYPYNPLSLVVEQDITYTAHFKVKRLTVNFVFDGSKFYSMEVDYGTTLSDQQLAEALTYLTLPECKTFDKWNGIPAKILADVNIEALSKQARAKLTVLSEDNSKGNVVITEDNVTVANYDCGDTRHIEAIAKEGYEFDHWSDNSDENPHAVEIGSEDKEYTAYFSVIKLTVTFLNCDGTLIGSKEVEYGQGVTAPEVTAPANHTFTGWDDMSFTNNVTANLTIHALCDIDQLIVRFYDFDNHQIDMKTVDYGSDIDPLTVATPDKPGLQFTGWDHPLVNITENLDVHPLYTIARLTVYFYNGDQLIATSEANYGEAPDFIPTATKTGYTFIGWDPDIEHVTIDGLKTYAQFNIVKYNVEFLDLNNNSLGTFAVEYGGTVLTPPTAPVVEGYTFIGWDKDFSIVTSDMQIHPVYELSQYIVHFVDWDNSPIADAIVQHGGTVAAPAEPVREGHTFAGWDHSLENITVDNLIIKALYDVNTYTVTFVALGQTVKTEQVEYGAGATAPFADEMPQKEGYHFTGNWDRDFSVVKADMTVIAEYDINIYKVTFVDWDGTILSVQNVNWGEDAVAPANPQRNNYLFSGWDTDFTNVQQNLTVRAEYIQLYYIVRFFDDITHQQIGADQEVEYQHSAVAPVIPDHTADGYHFAYWEPSDFSSVTQNMDIYAKYHKNVYTVRFIDWDGKPLGDVQQVEHGGSAVAPADPLRDGYTFVDWDKQFDFVTSDLTVKAVYEVVSFTVTFKNWDDSVLKIEVVPAGGTATPPADPKRDDYIFVGWDGDYTNVTEDRVIVAKFTGEYLTVRFHDYDGTVLWTSITSHGEPAIAPEEPTREGYEFIGWDKDYIHVTTDMDIYAQYQILSFTVRFFDIDLSTPVKTQTVEYMQSATAPALPEHEGMTFTGWSNDFSIITQSIDIYAQYEVKTWQVVFVNYNGQKWTQIVEHGGNAVPPALEERIGYEFTGWAGGSYEHVTANVTLTAQYKIKEYVVTFVDYLGVLLTQTVQHGGNATAPVARTGEGQQFTGWDAEFNFITSDLTVNAVYTYITYTVMFRDYDGTLLSTQQVPYGGSAVAPAQPTRDGYRFVEWDTPFYHITGNTIVTAVYSKDILEVTFREWNGEVIAVVEVQYGGTPVAPEPKEREGYHFTGWDKDIHGVYEDMDVRALYEINEYYVSVNTADPEQGTVTGGGTFKHGEIANISAVADEEYEFVAWLDENTMKPIVSLTEPQISITVTSDTALVAVFRLKPFALSLELFYAVCPGEVITLPSGVQMTVEENATVTDIVHYEYMPDVWCDSIFTCHLSVAQKPVMPAINLLPKVVYKHLVDLDAATVSIETALDNAKTDEWADIEDGWWEWLIDDEWTEYKMEIVNSYDTLSMRYGISTACGDTIYTAGMKVPVARQNADNCKECQEDFVAVIIYDWMLMLDKSTLNQKGYVFPADSVAWYKVVGSLDNLDDPENADDEEVGRGLYYTVDYTLAGTGDTYYAIVYLPEQSDDVPCQGLLRSGMLQFSLDENTSTQNEIVLRPTLAPPAQTLVIEGLNPNEQTTIRVYSSTGQLAHTFTVAGQTDVSITSEVTAGTYMVYIDSDTQHVVRKYIVKQ